MMYVQEQAIKDPEACKLAQDRYPNLTLELAVMYFVNDENRLQFEKPRGLGDTVAKIVHVTGLDKLAHAYTNATGRDCGCMGRQEDWNERYPYGD